ncbi:hypothetical protein JTE90_013126 [Oedothorax gibbosus]|uniref:Fatty acyl-CoA reductase n=1 Tax=Oedothorax gibbosus TaxID=931172 RepID=A0AAV6VKI3_9ARAC|nr:hypothetical protein JTE90_013126 [Oedothorax gibbosus]
MSNESTNKPVLPRIKDFYEGKSVFITGATGYLGVVLLESLLRLCPEIERIYILVRPKKGVQPESRKEAIFKKLVFQVLRETEPDVFQKVVVVSGDVSQPDLGMDEIGLQKIIENVSIVFHCAASISFLRPLSYILSHNAEGVVYTIELCRRLKKLKALVYTSTAFSNCNRQNTKIEENIYRLPFHSEKFIEVLRKGNESEMEEFMNLCHPHWPNYYTFSKNLAENIIKDSASDLPTAIVRPSLIVNVWKKPTPGFVEDQSGLSALTIGVGKGFIRVLHGSPDARLDLVPVDVCAQVHLMAAMKASLERYPNPLVINCSSVCVTTLGDFTTSMMKKVKATPLPHTFRTPETLKIVPNDFLYRMTAIYEHYVPAFFFDLFLKMAGSKIRLTKKYKFVEAAIQSTSYFMTHSWDYERENLRKCFIDMQPEDRQMLGTSFDGCDLEKLVEHVITVNPFVSWTTDKKSKSERMHLAKQRYHVTSFIQAISIFVVVGFFGYGSSMQSNQAMTVTVSALILLQYVRVRIKDNPMDVGSDPPYVKML